MILIITFCFLGILEGRGVAEGVTQMVGEREDRIPVWIINGRQSGIIDAVAYKLKFE